MDVRVVDQVSSASNRVTATSCCVGLGVVVIALGIIGLTLSLTNRGPLPQMHPAVGGTVLGVGLLLLCGCVRRCTAAQRELQAAYNGSTIPSTAAPTRAARAFTLSGDLYAYHVAPVALELLRTSDPSVHLCGVGMRNGKNRWEIYLEDLEHIANARVSLPPTGDVACLFNFDYHWALIYIDRRRRRIEYYDSLAGLSQKVLSGLGNLTARLSEHDGGPYQIYFPVEIDVQAADRHCGVWVLRTLERRLQKGGPADDILDDFQQIDALRQRYRDQYRALGGDALGRQHFHGNPPSFQLLLQFGT